MRTLLSVAGIALLATGALAQTDAQAQTDIQAQIDALALSCAGGRFEDCRQLMMRLNRSHPDAEATFAPAFNKARAVFEAACDRGDASESGCYGAGFMHFQLRAGDVARAVTFYERSCAGGYATGCNQLGNVYAAGIWPGVPWDIHKALASFERGCSAGDPGGCSIVAKALEGAPDIPADAIKEVPRDLKRAASLYQKACDMGEMPSCRRLAEMYEAGLGVRKDAARAGKLYARACEGGEKDACARKGTRR